MNYLLIAAAVLVVGLFVGYEVGKLITGLKYAVKLDNYKTRLDIKDDRIDDLNIKLKKEMEKNNNAK
jgi:hypothetical protein